MKITTTLFASIALLMLIGCSTDKTNPVTPSELQSDFSLPVTIIDETSTTHNLLGMWDVYFDIENLSAKIEPCRDSSAHFNVTTLIPPPGIVVGEYNPITNVIDLDVRLTNPYVLDVYDVRLIIFTDEVGHQLLNPDDWTPLYDIPGGLPVNPFKSYAKYNPQRKFEAQSYHIEYIQLYLPQGNMNVKFAIDASFPANCEEPYEISDFKQGNLYDVAGEFATVEVTVYDWQDNTNAVYLYCPQVTGTALVAFTQISSLKWQIDLVNNMGVTVGEYPGFVLATSSDSGQLALLQDVVITVTHKTPGWARSWGGGGSDICNDVCVDNDGNVYTTGLYKRTVDFDPSPFVDEHTSNGLNDIFISKIDNDGNYCWARTWGGPGTFDHGCAVAVDASSNTFVTGWFEDIVDFDPGSEIDLRASIGEQDLFVSKFDPDGNRLWALTMGGIDGDLGRGIATDNVGNVLVTGYFHETVDFDPGSGVNEHTSQGSTDVFLCKYDPDGNLVWALSWGGIHDEYSRAVTTDLSGNIFVTGDYHGLCDFDPGSGVDEHDPLDSYPDVYVSKFDSSGNFLWVRTWGGVQSQESHGVATDASRSVYVTGYFMETVDFDPSPDNIVEHTSKGIWDAYISKFSANGDFMWVKVWGSTDFDYGMDVVVDNSGNIYVTGGFQGLVDFDPGTGIDLHNSNGYNDIFISKFDSKGEFAWARNWGDVDDPDDHISSNGIAADQSGNIFTAGYFDLQKDFDPGPANDIHISNGATDVYLLKILPNGYWE